MSTLRVTDTTGRTVHIGPHDIHYGDVYPVHKDTTDAIVRIERVDVIGTLAVLWWRGRGTRTGAAVYDRDDRVEVAA